MKVGILQSNYIPWKGYFNLIKNVDVFCFHDDLQYTKNDWRNRNQIKTDQGLRWLTIPCGTNEKRLICEVKIDDTSWQKKHFHEINKSYKKAPNYQYIKEFLNDFYLENKWKNLFYLNQYLIKRISREFLKIKTTIFMDSRQFNLNQSKNRRVIELLKKIGAKEYISGPAAKNYLKKNDFIKNKIKLTYMDYTNYKIYNQFYSPFTHQVSIIDLLMHVPLKNINDYINS